jgi:hypothetical protein
MAPNFLSVKWHGEVFQELGAHDVKSSILVGSLFLLDGRRREGKKKEKKITLGEEGFPGLDLPCWLCSRS